MYLDKAKARFKELHIVPIKNIFPCTQEEVTYLEQKLKRPLPAAYREFLLWMGHGAGDFLAGTDCFYWDLILLQRDAIEFMEEDTFPQPLPKDAFVFLMHQGYQFDFFRTSEGNDPPIYYYFEEKGKQGSLSTVYAHYSDFLLALIEDHAKIHESIAQREKNLQDHDFTFPE